MSCMKTTAPGVMALMFFALLAGPAMAQQPPQPEGDPRQAISLSPEETARMLAGMREYLETIQGIVAAIAENDTKRVPAIASQSGAKMVQKVAPTTGLKLQLAFTTMSFDTHDKFDKLAEKAQKGASRRQI